jgi:hypothetical protein
MVSGEFKVIRRFFNPVMWSDIKGMAHSLRYDNLASGNYVMAVLKKRTDTVNGLSYHMLIKITLEGVPNSAFWDYDLPFEPYHYIAVRDYPG